MMINNDDAVLINDLGVCSPGKAISEKQWDFTWRLVDYTTEEFTGKMLMAGPETEAPDLHLDLEVSGWHAVYFGLWAMNPRLVEGISVKISDDDAFTYLQAEPINIDAWERVDEVFWKRVNISGQHLIIRHPERFGSKAVSFLLYVKLVPLKNEASAEILEGESVKPLIALNDGHGILYRKKQETVEDIVEDIIPYKGTDFKKIFWCLASGDIYTCDTEAGERYGENLSSFPRKGDRNIAESIKTLSSRGIEIPKVVLAYGRKYGLEVYFSHRLEAFSCIPPWDGIFTGSFFRNNPQLRCRDRDGREICRMSYAFDEVQDYETEILKELASYNPDGISLLFPRGAPYLLYEQPLIDDFHRRFGKDPCNLPEDNPEWIQFRGKVMTRFMRKVREELNGISLAVHVLNNQKNNHFYGLLLEEWVKEDLIDELTAYPWQNKEIDVDYFIKLAGGSSCKLYIEMMPRQMSPEKYRKKALALYEKGVDGLSFWDTNGRHIYARQWSIVQRLGHEDVLRKGDSGEGVFYKDVKLKSIGGCPIDRYSPAWSF